MRETELFHGQIELLERLASANADSLLASTCASLRWRPLTAVGTVAAPPRRARGSKGLEVPGDRSDPLAGCLPARRAMPAGQPGQPHRASVGLCVGVEDRLLLLAHQRPRTRLRHRTPRCARRTARSASDAASQRSRAVVTASVSTPSTERPGACHGSRGVRSGIDPLSCPALPGSLQSWRPKASGAGRTATASR